MLILLACFALTLLYYRQKRTDVWFWSFLFWLALVGTGWRHWEFATDYDWTILMPLIIRDLLTVGLVGLVQSMAVRKQIPIWQAVLFMFALFAASRMIEVGVVDHGADVENFRLQSRSDHSPSDVDDAFTLDFEYLVDLNLSKASEADLICWAAQYGYRVERAFTMLDEDATDLDDYYVLDAPALDPQTTDRLRKSGLFDDVEENDIFELELPKSPSSSPLPSPRWGETDGVSPRWGVTNGPPPIGGARGGSDPLVSQQWAYDALDFKDYYQALAQMPKPRKKARLFILDTGVDAQHEDLRSNYRSHKSKYDTDLNGHGSHCAGIAAATTHNGLGIASLNVNGLVEVSGVQVISRYGMGTQKTIISGILEAADAGADVISLSLGGRSSGDKRRAYSRAVNYARRKGAIVVVAAGNSSRLATDYVPASAAGVITVAAVDQQLQRAVFTNTLEGIANPICAPGVAIHSTIPKGYKTYSGTSMACPQVAGLLAVMRAYDPSLDTEGAYQILHETGKVLPESGKIGRLVQPGEVVRRLQSL
ncbi:MAG: S8 family serine peptidase [Bacteroidota bacterium]